MTNRATARTSLDWQVQANPGSNSVAIQATVAAVPGVVRVSTVTYIDAAGKAFLAARHAEGAEFVASGCLMKAVVAEIAGAPIPDCARPEGEGESPTSLSGGAT